MKFTKKLQVHQINQFGLQTHTNHSPNLQRKYPNYNIPYLKTIIQLISQQYSQPYYHSILYLIKNMGDIISLYETAKPYPQKVQEYVKNEYSELQKSRISLLTYTIPTALLYIYSSFNVQKTKSNTFNRTKLHVFGTTFLGLVTAHLLYEAYLWNNHLAKLYLIQREKLYYA